MVLRLRGAPTGTGKAAKEELVKFTVSITQECNLRCSYCYIEKKPISMSRETAGAVVDFIFESAIPGEKIDIGFFGGEPLLRLDLIRYITGLIENHPSYTPEKVQLAVVTNGTILSDEIAEFLNKHNIAFCLSCDGPASTQDMFRRFPNGNGSSALVEKTLRQALQTFPTVLVNAVYHPSTFNRLPDVVHYFSNLGLRQIYLNPDFSATWTGAEAEQMAEVYAKLGALYIDYYLRGQPHYISFIDSKIAVILRNGYDPLERCRMGRGEFAFAASGNVYPCERLIGSDDGHTNCLGNITNRPGLRTTCSLLKPTTSTNTECQNCTLNSYCMNWCGCSNYFQSGRYDRVGPFLCASERAAIATSFHVMQTLEQKIGTCFFDHFAGEPTLNSVLR